MLIDGVELIEGGVYQNLVVPKGTAFPTPPDYGELFYRTDEDVLYFYENTTSTWVPVAKSDQLSKWSVFSGSDIYKSVGNVAIGVSDPQGYKLRVSGTIRFDGSLDMGANTVSTTATPVTASHLTNKNYVDTVTAFEAQLAYLSSNQTINDSVATEVPFNSETYDTSNIHDPSANNTQFVVPAGKSKVRLSFKVTFDGNASGVRSIEVTKNNAFTYPGYVKVEEPGSLSGNILYINTPILHVNAGDVFRLVAFQDSGVSLSIVGIGTGYATWGGMEVLD